MVLTDEQRERIKRNRERALEIRRKKEKERQEAQTKAQAGSQTIANEGTKEVVIRVGNDQAAKEEPSEENVKQTKSNNQTHISNNDNTTEEVDEGIELEDFEIGASQYVTKQQAMKIYCLPPGTLAVCSYIEKDNPRQSKWSKMKLYDRSEIRRRARKRFGGLNGLVEERRKREMKRFERDFEDSNDVFYNNKRQKK
mmetsp:Transcript_24133/g.35945  ORF Transcript_24133/g.35945 Transcript_24133/m.35945 type:complete len:197 (-) Transcript_24133:313-903(-)